MKTFSTIACGLIAAGIAAAPASAATVYFDDFNTSTDGTDGIVRSFTSSDGKVSVKAIGFSYQTTSASPSYSNANLKTAFLGDYSSNGLGVTSQNETGGGNTHTVDNQDGFDFVMLVFDKAVNLTGGVLNPYSLGGYSDNDAFVSYTNLNGGLTYASLGSTLTTTQFNTMVSNNLFTTLNSNGKNVEGSGSGALTNLNITNTNANVWIIGAARAGVTGYDGKIDAFKLASVNVNPVPEPATWAMMISGFGMIGFSMRRRRRVTVSFA